MTTRSQNDLFLDGGADVALDAATTRRALDELFCLTQQYKSTQAYCDLLLFVANFRFYAPYNAMLIHIQRPGATFVCTPSRWLDDFKREIKPGSSPLLILQPMGPVMFVFDVLDTIPFPGAPQLPSGVESPFEVSGTVDSQFERTTANALRDGVEVSPFHGGSQQAGQIASARSHRSLRYQTKFKPEPEFVPVPLRYELLLNSSQPREVQYATFVHELAHLYCGHLGSPNPLWWPDRRGCSLEEREFEAESVSYLVCRRLGIDTPSEDYLAGYLERNSPLPTISLEAVMVAANLIEKMGRERLKPRKESKK